jgi:hypothetical protein
LSNQVREEPARRPILGGADPPLYVGIFRPPTGKADGRLNPSWRRHPAAPVQSVQTTHRGVLDIFPRFDSNRPQSRRSFGNARRVMTVLSCCRTKREDLGLAQFQAAATASRHVFNAAARKVRCVRVEIASRSRMARRSWRSPAADRQTA